MGQRWSRVGSDLSHEFIPFKERAPAPRNTLRGNYMNTVVTLLVALQDRIFGSDEERGATATEYALLLAFIAIVIIVAVTALGTNLSGLFNTASSSV